MSHRPERIAFLGFGLIGGSIARAIVHTGLDAGTADRPRLAAWTPTGDGPRRALADGIIDEAPGTAGEAIDGADLVVIASPPIEAIELVRRLGDDLNAHLGSGCLVTDVTSTKVAILAAAEDAGVPFVGGHPMAGRETSGYESATDDLFADRPWIIVRPTGGTDTIAEPVFWLARACGARPVEMSALEHDAAVAAVSHLPLVAAAALVELVLGRDAHEGALGRDAHEGALGRDAHEGALGRDAHERALTRTLAASGWASATRLALGDPRMGAGIVATNAEQIAINVRALRDALDAWLAAIEQVGGPDAEAIERRFASARTSLLAGPDHQG